MKLQNIFVTATLGLFLTTACATTKYKTFNTTANFKTAGKMVMGKSPKETAAIIGQPMSAYYKDDNSVYYMVYPMSDSEVSMTDVMFNDRLECLTLNFEKEKDFKYDGWQTDVSFTCGAIKGEKLDMSLIN
jgi:hypothetical protein